MSVTPDLLGLRMPPEWARHARTLISWPVRQSMCHPEAYEELCRSYNEIIQAIAEFEPVTILVNKQEVVAMAMRFYGQQFQVLHIEHDDAWLRDNGPAFLVGEDEKIAGVNWRFNAWGEKYPDWEQDDQVATKVLQYFSVRQFDAPFILEGGAIHVDGEGTLLTTESCLLHAQRNPHLSKNQMEAYLQSFLGVQKVLWLKRGLAGDETDGHIDNVACFAQPGQVLMQICADPADENYAITQENLSAVRHMTDAMGRELEIVTLPQPPAMFAADGQRLTLSYMNFYFVNGGIILPVFGGAAEKTDHAAQEILRQTFPERRIRAIDGLAVVREGGNIHCLTQQMPPGRPYLRQ
ncbi:MAG: agmatine deiminase family protein [Peptococcaceae bacterium]|nr:agmatine deiminase family protein [Peptococcaceae bacterium]